MLVQMEQHLGTMGVRKGREPAFFWYGEGEYELILHRPHCFKDALSGGRGVRCNRRRDGEGLHRCQTLVNRPVLGSCVMLTKH